MDFKNMRDEKGIWQGCPISAILHLSEIFSIKIKQNQNIKGFKTGQRDKGVKNIQHADDMILTLKNIDSVNKALETIWNICIHTGSKININKTECILLGLFESLFDELNGIRVTNRAVKCHGIHIGHDKLECYNKNWMKV